jgi:acyl-CoA synthetase (NDP forming)
MSSHHGPAALIPEDIAKKLLAEHGIPTPAASVCTTAEEVAEFIVAQPSDSFVLKLSMDTLVHKSAVGGVRLAVPGDEAVSEFTALLALGAELEAQYGEVRGVLIEQHVGEGVEVVLGFQVDSGLGPVVMVGDGGTDIENARRVVFALAPVSVKSARNLVTRWCALPSSAGASLSMAARHRIADLLTRLAGSDGLAFALDTESIDINPIIVCGEDVVAVDAVIQAGRSPDSVAAERTTGKVRGNLSAFTDPKSIAVVGASSDPSKVGTVLLQNIIDFGFAGKVYPVHPTATEIAGLAAYPSISAIPEVVEKAIVVVGRDHVPEVVRQCADKGVDAVQVYSSGFSEYADATSVEQQIREALAGTNTRMMGPNCWGAYSPRSRITTNAVRFSGTRSGHVGFISQSGTHFSDVVRRSKTRNLPLFAAVSVGNCLDLQVYEMAHHLLDQDDVHVLGMYLEGTAHAREIVELAASSPKPIVVMRGGRTAQGGRAASSHTAALVGDDSVWASLFTEAGIVLVDTIEEMLDTLTGFAVLPAINGTRLSVIGTGGGVAVTAADIASRNKLILSEFPVKVSDELARRFGQPGTSMHNPVDLTVWDFFAGGSSRLSEMLSLIGVPAVADSTVAFLDVGSILDLNSEERANKLFELLISDLKCNRPAVPLTLVARTGGDTASEALLRRLQECLHPAGVMVVPRVQDAILTHARIASHSDRNVVVA